MSRKGIIGALIFLDLYNFGNHHFNEHLSRGGRLIATLEAVAIFGLQLNWNSYLVDPASSHMLVSKIKPCMSKYKQIHTVKLRMAH
jgi:hypothetical protein